jgi:hypothetical protein
MFTPVFTFSNTKHDTHLQVATESRVSPYFYWWATYPYQIFLPLLYGPYMASQDTL